MIPLNWLVIIIGFVASAIGMRLSYKPFLQDNANLVAAFFASMSIITLVASVVSAVFTAIATIYASIPTLWVGTVVGALLASWAAGRLFKKARLHRATS